MIVFYTCLLCPENATFPGREEFPHIGSTSLCTFLALSDFFLLPNHREIIKSTHFEGKENMKKALTMELRGISQKSFKQSTEAWQRIRKFIKLKRSYDYKETMYGDH